MAGVPSDFDYVIVGAGSAGCVLANRLTEDAGTRVLLLEAGGPDRDPFIHMPAGVYKIWHDPKLNWNYRSEPDAGMLGRQIPVPRGKVLGGSSSINSMVYLRGHPSDYDRWAGEFGLPGWDYAHCLPYFKKAERSERGADDWHGDDGPLGTSKPSTGNVLYDAFREAGAEAGVGSSDDLNGYRPEGLGLYDSTKWNGRRCSAAVGYLHPVMNRPNLTVETRAHVLRVDMDGDRAVGVTYDQGGQRKTVRAGAEVILSGGAINSPQLLMLSGIGPEDELKAAGIDCKLALPGVGRNLQDHIDLKMQWACTRPVTLKNLGHPLVKLGVGIQWLATRKGPVASNIWEAGGLVRTEPGLPAPNIQYHFAAVGMDYDANGKIRLQQGFQIHISQLRQEARGELKLNGSDPHGAPKILFNFLTTEHDRKELVDGILLGRHIINTPAFRDFLGAEQLPGPTVRTRADALDYVRAVSETEFHPSCTCRMGADDMAVVDSDLKVRGVQGLRVVDASVMPNVISSNLNATVIMIAEKAADAIRGRAPLPPFRPKFFFDVEEPLVMEPT
ncbi:Choline dehydrogenase (plasmid) [Paracoccaceae bacterium]|nr:Choline dehydrogenase [Paracoccaceae bacterium]